MFCKPCERLARGVSLACDVSRRRSVFQHAQVAVVASCISRVGAQSSYSEIGKSEAFDLWYVYGSITVYEIGGRAVSLVACYCPMAMSPLCPLAREVVQEHVGEGFTIVAHHLLVAVDELVEHVFKPVSPSLFKFGEECRCPVSAIHLITVVEKRVRERRVVFFKRFGYMAQIVCHGSGVEVVYHISLASWSGAFHLLSCPAFKQCDDPLSVILSFDGKTSHHLQLCKAFFLLWYWEFYVIDDYTAVDNSIYGESLACRLVDRHPRTAERPSCSCSHSGFNVKCTVFLFHNRKHLHPFRR